MGVADCAGAGETPAGRWEVAVAADVAEALSFFEIGGGGRDGFSTLLGVVAEGVVPSLGVILDTVVALAGGALFRC